MNELDDKIVVYKAAAAELSKLKSMRGDKVTARDEAITAAAKLRAGLGERLLQATEREDAHAESVAVSETTAAQVRADGLGQVIAALDVRITSATTAMHQAHAGCVRSDASRLRNLAAEVQKPIDALLLQLRTLAGCDYEPVRNKPGAMPMMVVNGKATQLPGTLANGGVPQIVRLVRPAHEELLEQAGHFDVAAIAIEAGAPLETSFVTGLPLARIPNYLEQVAPVQALPMEKIDGRK